MHQLKKVHDDDVDDDDDDDGDDDDDDVEAMATTLQVSRSVRRNASAQEGT